MQAQSEKNINNEQDSRENSSGDPSPQKGSSITDRARSRGRRKEPPGILRLDSTSRSPRYNIAAPLLAPQVVPSSPQPSVDRLSVTFAITDEPSNPASREVVFRDQKSQLEFIIEPLPSLVNNREVEMRRVPAVADCTEEIGEEDDYSASASAIIQRRASLRRPSRRKRRSSSPFNAEAEGGVRRRSSAFTTSSGETAISVDEGGTQEQIFENLKLHKEVLSGVKQQPWPLRRKIKLVQQAKSYVRRHEGVLQERLAQNRSTRDVIARASILFNKYWQYFRREFVNLQTWLIPWELRIKEIESHFGSAVASYFIFLRWLFWINLVIAATLAAFVAVPQMVTADKEHDGERKMLDEEIEDSKNLLTLWEFEGVLKYSAFFYGWYTNRNSGSSYNIPLAYFLVNLVVYIYSFVAILRKMAENSRMSKLSEKEDECGFTWKLFTGWDFMIGNPETAHNRIASIVLGFKEALLEEAEKQKVERNWKTVIVRTFVNLAVAFLLALSAWAVVLVVARSEEPEAESSWWRQNEITVVIALISFVFPMFFEILGIFENYHPRKQLRFQLARIMVLNLLNLYSLIFALFGKINSMTKQLTALRHNVTKTLTDPRNSTSRRCCRVFCTNFTMPVTTAASLSLGLLTTITSQNTTAGLITSDGTPMVAQALTNNVSPLTNDISLTVPESITTSSTPTTTDYYDYSDYETNDTDFVENDEVGTELNSTEEEPPVTVTIDNNEVNTSTSTNQESIDEILNFTDSSTTDSTSATYSSSTVDQNFTGILVDFTGTTTSSTTNSLPSTETSPVSTTSNVIDRKCTVDEMTVDHLGSDKPTHKETKDCWYQCCEPEKKAEETDSPVPNTTQMDINERKKLRRLCWETMFGQELTKLTVMDLVLTVLSTLGMDFFRAVFVRHMNNIWCWDLEKQFPQYGDFKIAENILHLVNNQGMVWMGMFFSPGLPTLNVIKIGILMYLRSWAVLTCNVPHEIVFRASRSNNFYLALLLTMLFLCVLPVGYAVVRVEPSWHCGPFSDQPIMYSLITNSLKSALPKDFAIILDYIASPGIVIPLIVLMALIIYYMVSLTGSLREANNDLKIQLRQERTEERRKMFQIVEKRQEIQDAPFVRWKKILPVLPTNKTAGVVVIEEGTAANVTLQRKELRKQSAASEAGEATDVEQDSLPHDPGMVMPEVVVDVDPNNKKHVKQIKNRSCSSGSVREGDSMGSQGSDYGVIPKIRISGTGSATEIEHHSSPGRTSATSVESQSRAGPSKTSSSEAKPEAE
ncbi:transmembrane channel-like protein [Neodiprion virginianus]|uniref:transmembrane channel-like protein n=1 Tax=Neodiprion virginianus TaxID=2961670 RepID=UPI001EE74BBD|nr:transmembrane channel-like protein [Neodiprion virginianus]